MNCYLTRNYKNTKSSGNKAKTDMENLMESLGFRNIGLKRTFYSGKVITFILNLSGIIKGILSIRKGDVLFLQYPLKKYFSFLCNAVHLKGCKVVILIHDLGSFRRKRLTPAHEIKRLAHADYIIAANASMKQWLEEHQCPVPIGIQGVWDYLSTTSPSDTYPAAPPYKIVYAGALSRRKNSFLYQWKCTKGMKNHHYSLVIYGSGFEPEHSEAQKYIDYKGFIKPDQLIASPNGHFGLVWDGNSTDTCSGNFGEYLQYNNPHKTSLYIRCGLPIIIWDKAALAPFVREHHIGICIRCLEELDTLLPSLAPQEYDRMRNNVLQISKQIANGHYFTQAIEEAMKHIHP